jgi:type I restriction enzyme M protein
VLADRYGQTMPALAQQVSEAEARVAGHLERMGFAWR